MTDITEQLDDLIRQATEERSHFYVKSVAELAQQTIHQLRTEIRRLSTRFYQPSDVAQYMNGEMPTPKGSRSGADIAWIKTLRERSHCTLQEAKHAHDMCAALSSVGRAQGRPEGTK